MPQTALAFADALGNAARNDIHAEAEKAIGGLRRAGRSIKKAPGVIDKGAVVGAALDDFYDKHPGLPGEGHRAHPGESSSSSYGARY